MASSHGAYIYNRFVGGEALMGLLSRRFSLFSYAPSFIVNWIKKMIANSVYNQEALRLTPKYSSSGSINDQICLRICSGKVILKPGIEHIEGNRVYFENGSFVDNVDDIILCTGYKRDFPFIDKTLLEFEHHDKYIPLYKGVFSPKFRERLAFAGFQNTLNASTITSEMESRYAAEVIKGNVKLPDIELMRNDIDAKEGKHMRINGVHSKEYNDVSCYF